MNGFKKKPRKPLSQVETFVLMMSLHAFLVSKLTDKAHSPTIIPYGDNNLGK